MTNETKLQPGALDPCWNRIGVWSQTAASCPELKQVIHCRNCDRYSAAGKQMLERAVPDDYRQEWTERFRQTEQKKVVCDKSALLFRLGDEWLGIDSQCVTEITPMRAIHSLPHKDSQLVKGLVNVRGELKICVSLGAVLQLEKARESYETDHEILERMISVEAGDDSFVFPVSEVHGTHHYAEQAIQPPPATVANAKSNYTSGVIDWKDSHVGLLDHSLLFYALSRGLK